LRFTWCERTPYCTTHNSAAYLSYMADKYAGTDITRDDIKRREVIAKNLKALIDPSTGAPATYTRLGKAAGVDPRTVERWATKTNAPPAEKLVAIAEAFRVSLDWLMRGVGPRELRAPTDAPLEVQVGAYVRAQLAAYTTRPEQGASRSLSKAFDHISDFVLGRAALIRMSEVLPVEFIEAERHQVQTMKSRELAIQLNDQASLLSQPLVKRLLKTIEGMLRPGPGAAKIEAALTAAARESVAVTPSTAKGQGFFTGEPALPLPLAIERKVVKLRNKRTGKIISRSPVVAREILALDAEYERVRPKNGR
jgi:transcriptional regulator with XRE-family HTH domain